MATRSILAVERHDTIIHRRGGGAPRTGSVTRVDGPRALVDWSDGRESAVDIARLRAEVPGKPISRIGYYLRKAPRYVGVVEYTDRKTHGYYWPWTPEAEQALRQILEAYQQLKVGDYRLHITVEPKLRELERAHPEHIGRVSLANAPTDGWEAFAARATVEQTIKAEDPFQRGRGLGPLRRLPAQTEAS